MTWTLGRFAHGGNMRARTGGYLHGTHRLRLPRAGGDPVFLETVRKENLNPCLRGGNGIEGRPRL